MELSSFYIPGGFTDFKLPGASFGIDIKYIVFSVRADRQPGIRKTQFHKDRYLQKYSPNSEGLSAVRTPADAAGSAVDGDGRREYAAFFPSGGPATRRLFGLRRLGGRARDQMKEDIGTVDGIN